jgi:Protein of unknown function (DUF3102)
LSTLPARQRQQLPALADEIRREHENVVASARTTVEAAIRCGWLLHEAKAQVPHGAWLDWLDTNFPASKRTAQVYMRVATQHRLLDRANPQLPAPLTLEEAVKQLATPREGKREEASSNRTPTAEKVREAAQEVVEPAAGADELARLRADVGQAKRGVANAQARLDRAKAALRAYREREGGVEW